MHMHTATQLFYNFLVASKRHTAYDAFYIQLFQIIITIQTFKPNMHDKKLNHCFLYAWYLVFWLAAMLDSLNEFIGKKRFCPVAYCSIPAKVFDNIPIEGPSHYKVQISHAVTYVAQWDFQNSEMPS